MCDPFLFHKKTVRFGTFNSKTFCGVWGWMRLPLGILWWWQWDPLIENYTQWQRKILPSTSLSRSHSVDRSVSRRVAKRLNFLAFIYIDFRLMWASMLYKLYQTQRSRPSLISSHKPRLIISKLRVVTIFNPKSLIHVRRIVIFFLLDLWLIWHPWSDRQCYISRLPEPRGENVQSGTILSPPLLALSQI